VKVRTIIVLNRWYELIKMHLPTCILQYQHTHRRQKFHENKRKEQQMWNDVNHSAEVKKKLPWMRISFDYLLPILTPSITIIQKINFTGCLHNDLRLRQGSLWRNLYISEQWKNEYYETSNLIGQWSCIEN